MNAHESVSDGSEGEAKATHLALAELPLTQGGLVAQKFAVLNSLFQSGSVPAPPPEGRYAGKLIALDIAPGLTQLFRWLANRWMPWLGKTFDAARQSGDNIFSQDSYWLARLFNPLYGGFRVDGPGTYRAFAFRSYVGAGLFDPDRQVLKIDYDLEGNPSPTIRRVLDELVHLSDDVYLGKAHAKWWWGGWQTVAYFALSREESAAPLSPHPPGSVIRMP